LVFLTVAIPSLNGAQFIKQTLTSFFQQIEPSMAVELLVMENASTDATLQVCEEMQQQHSELRIVSNLTTVPFDVNVANAVREANGEYVWIMADDDVPEPGALSLVYQSLQSHRPATLLSNFRKVGPNLEEFQSAEELTNPSSGNNVPKLTVFENAEEALIGASFDVFGLLSAIVVRRLDYVQLSNNLNLGLPEGFDFLYLVPRIMQRGSTVFIDEELVLFRQYKKRWETSKDYSQSMNIFFVIIPTILTRLAEAGYSKKTIRSLKRHHLANLTQQLITASESGMRYRGEFFRKLVQANTGNPVFWLQVPVFLLPRTTLKKLEFVYKGRLADFLRNSL
jgi:glycosyltransferase involved in cell wall biosynthesis